MDRRKATSITLNIVTRVTPAAHDPSQIGLPRDIRGGVEKDVHWSATIGESHEFEIVIVPAKGDAASGVFLTRRVKALAESGPSTHRIRTVLFLKIGRKDMGKAEGFDDPHRGIKISLNVIQSHVARRH